MGVLRPVSAGDGAETSAPAEMFTETLMSMKLPGKPAHVPEIGTAW
jgi:hypothetical protein